MKKYIKPVFEAVELRLEERLATCTCYKNLTGLADCPPAYNTNFGGS